MKGRSGRLVMIVALFAALAALALAGYRDNPESTTTTRTSVVQQKTVVSSITTTSIATTTTSGLPASLPMSARPLRVPILMYHYVDSTPPKVGRYAAGLTVRTDEFEAQMNYLAANGYHTVTLDQIYASMAGGAGLPSRPVAVTFDDGEADNYTVAFPILRAHGFVATFFVITAFVGRANCLNWDQALLMQQAGMSIESHTVHHFDLATLNSLQLASEMIESRRTIKSMLGADADVVAYPSGEKNALVEKAAQAAGYRMAVGTQPGYSLSPGSVFEWPRVRMSPGIGIKTFASIVKN